MSVVAILSHVLALVDDMYLLDLSNLTLESIDAVDEIVFNFQIINFVPVRRANQSPASCMKPLTETFSA